MKIEQNPLDNTEEQKAAEDNTSTEEEQKVTEDNTSEQEETPSDETVVEKIDASTMDVDEMESKLDAQKEAIFNKSTEDDTSHAKQSDENDTEDNTSGQAEKGNTGQHNKTNQREIKVTKDYIADQPEEHRKILESALGTRDHVIVDKQVLKNYVNAQVQIDNNQSEIERLRNEQKVPEHSKEEADQVTALTNELVEAELRTKYPDMPSMSDKEAFTEWKRDLNYNNPDGYYDFRETSMKLGNEFKKEAENEVSLATNWKGMAQMQTEKELSSFESYIKEKGFELKDLGIDRNDGEFIKTILFKEGKNNDEVIQMYKGKIPIVMDGRVLSHLKDRYMDKIIELSSFKARTDAYTKKESLKPNPSLNNTNIAGRVTEVEQGKAQVRRFSGDEDVDTLEEKLDLQKESLGITGTSNF